ncbi:MAG: DUF1573 domain-containing protein [bacterium]|nr:DUF1573 domain-containing protein [bacterium]
MKNLLALCLFAIISTASFAQEATPVVEEEKLTLDGPYIAFFEKSHDFKDITQGDKVEHIFEFENSGTTPLIISNVMVTCGCTAPDWPRTPIAPGETSQIKVVFNSTGKIGRQNKVITIVSNATNNPEKIKIVTNVLAPQSSEAGE